jgi:hypothetical protein
MSDSIIIAYITDARFGIAPQDLSRSRLKVPSIFKVEKIERQFLWSRGSAKADISTLTSWSRM